MEDVPDYCPQSTRMYWVSAFSLALTATLISVSIFMGKNRVENEGKFRFINKENEPVPKEYFDASVALSVISGLFTTYVIGVTWFEETWETSALTNLLPYRYIIEQTGLDDINPALFESFDKDVPCYKRKTSGSCTVHPNSRDCFWDDSTETCKRTYSGGYGNILVFVGCSIYLIIAGIMIIRDQKDSNNVSPEFDNLATASIIIGCLGLLYSFIDLVIC